MATSAEPTEPRFYTWKAEPGERGTFSILITCLITMTLCVWTAIHLNLPEYQKESRQKWRKVGWLFIALLAPEMVAFTAYTQYQEAQRISQFVRKHWEQPEPVPWTSEAWSTMKKVLAWAFWLTLGLPILLCYYVVQLCRSSNRKVAEDPKSEKTGKDYANPNASDDGDNEGVGGVQSQQRHPWTLTHSFFVAMGGFALDTRGAPNYLHGKKRRMTLTIRGLSWLLQNGAEQNPIPDVSEREILDRSKANELAKTLVCLQATWFCVQCFTRWGEHLFVSLLELNTLAHCFCALLIYLLWWSKPLDIAEPSLLQGTNINSLGAVMTMFSYRTVDLEGTSHYPMLRYVDMDVDPTTEKRPIVHKQVNTNNEVDLQPNDAFAGFLFLGFQNPTTNAVVAGTLTLDSTAVQCWQLAGEAFKSNKVPYQRVWRGPKNDVYIMKEFLSRSDLKMLEDRVINRPSTTDWVPVFEKLDGMGLLRHTRSLLTLGFALAGFCYGGLHLVAWNSPFRTELERRLWKLSGIVLASSGILIFLFAFIFDLIKYNELGRRRRWQLKAVGLGMDLREYLTAYSASFPYWQSDRFYNQLRYILYFFAGCGGLLYVLCRFYLVVESFIGISHLPESAFSVPVWSKYFPHIT